MYMCWGSNTLATDAHMKIAHNPLDLVSEARVSELQSVDCALQTFETEEKTSRTKQTLQHSRFPGDHSAEY